jgi:hypothetical protein
MFELILDDFDYICAVITIVISSPYADLEQ